MTKWVNLVWVPQKIRVYRSGWKKLIDVIFPRFEEIKSGGRFIAIDENGEIIESKSGLDWEYEKKEMRNLSD